MQNHKVITTPSDKNFGARNRLADPCTSVEIYIQLSSIRIELKGAAMREMRAFEDDSQERKTLAALRGKYVYMNRVRTVMLWAFIVFMYFHSGMAGHVSSSLERVLDALRIFAVVGWVIAAERAIKAQDDLFGQSLVFLERLEALGQVRQGA
jgi:hypothetical protein